MLIPRFTYCSCFEWSRISACREGTYNCVGIRNLSPQIIFSTIVGIGECFLRRPFLYIYIVSNIICMIYFLIWCTNINQCLVEFLQIPIRHLAFWKVPEDLCTIEWVWVANVGYFFFFIEKLYSRNVLYVSIHLYIVLTFLLDE